MGKGNNKVVSKSRKNLQIDESDDEIEFERRKFPNKQRHEKTPKQAKIQKRRKLNFDSSESESEESSPSPVVKRAQKKTVVTKKTTIREIPARSKKDIKKTLKRKHDDLSPDTDYDTDPDEADYKKLESAGSELLSVAQMKERTKIDYEKKYHQSKKFIKWYEKEYIKKALDDENPTWETADKLMTAAAATLKKYKGLEKANIKPDSHLKNAIPKLKAGGELKFKKALDIVANLSPEDTALFWEKQIRNKDVTSFEDLVTKKAHERTLIHAEVQQELDSKKSEDHEVQDVELEDEVVMQQEEQSEE